MNTLLHRLLCGPLLVLLCTVAVAQEPQSPMKVDIDAQRLDKALNAWARQTGFSVMISVERAAQGRIAPKVVGTYTPEEALKLLLAPTDLVYEFVDARTVAVRPTRAKPQAGLPSSQLQSGEAEGSEATRLALLESSGNGESEQKESQRADSSSSDEAKEGSIAEVIVTAQKRSERLQDVPVPVTAIDPDTLVEQNLLRLQDYYTRIPGLNMTPAVLSSSILSIRGLVTGGGNPTVGFTVDDVPYGGSTLLAGSGVVPDLDPGELAQIEVLRGPQGTLYGASSMGGLVKFVTRDPSTDSFGGRVQVGTSSVHNGSELGYNVRGSMNVPLSDTMALGISGFTRRDPGYIDDPVLGLEGVNELEVRGGRLSMSWRPSDAFSLKLGALFQRSQGEGAPGDDIALGDLQQSRLRGSGWDDRKVQAYSATVSAKLGRADLIALSGYNVNTYFNSFDSAYLYARFVQPLFGVSGVELGTENENTKFTQEIRLALPLGSRVEWLLGGFFTDEDSLGVQTIEGVNPVTLARAGVYRSTNSPNTYREYAAFTNLTVHVTDRFDVQVGGRESRIRQTYEQTQVGPGATAAGITPESNADTNAFTYLLTPRFKVSPDLMVYARLASGYRAGGINSFAGPGTPLQYEPDRTRSYEAGIKGAVLDRALTFDASLYYIDWQDIQLSVVNPQTVRGYAINASHAKSQGVELSMESRPLAGLTLSGWVAWNDAQLTEPFPTISPTRGGSGDRLPFSSRVSGNFSVEQELTITGNVTGVLGGSVSYIGAKEGGFTAGTGLRQTYPGYAQIDLRAGLRRDAWTADLFVTNLADKRGALYGGLGSSPPLAFIYIQPRTIGVSLARTF